MRTLHGIESNIDIYYHYYYYYYYHYYYYYYLPTSNHQCITSNGLR